MDVRERTGRWLFLLLLVAPLLPLWRCLFMGEAIGPFDQIHQLAPWHGPKPTAPWDVLQADGVLQFYVWRDLVFDAWGKGQLPFWNPYVLAGTPLMGNSQSAALYPPHVLLGMLHVPTAFAMFLLAWAHLAWAGLGVHRLVLRLGGKPLGGAVAGLTFALSPFMIGWTALPSVIETVSWIPWVLAGAAALVRPSVAGEISGKVGPFSLTATGAARLRSLIGLSVSIAMLLLAGHIQFAAYGFVALFVLVVGMLIFSKGDPATGEAPRKGIPSVAIIAALLLGGALAAPQFLAVMNYSQFSHRRTPPTEQGYHDYLNGALKPFSLGTLPMATLTGHPAHFPVVADAAQMPPVSAYWPQIDPPSAPFAEAAIAIGPLAFTLLFLAPWRKRSKELAPVALVGVVAALLAFGTALNAVLYYGVPGWAATGSPGRVGVLIVLAGAVIAGLAIGNLPPLTESGPRKFLPLLLPLIVTIPCVILAQQAPMHDATSALVSVLVGSAITQALPGLLISVVVAALALSCAYQPEKRGSQIVLLLTPFALFLAGGGLDLMRTGDPSFLKTSPLAPQSPFVRVAIVNGPWAIPVAAPALAPGNTSAVARVHELSGYDSLLHRDTDALLKDIDGQDPATPANGNMMFVKTSADKEKLAQAGVTEVWSLKPMPQLGDPVGSSGDALHYVIPGPGRASTPAGPATIEEETPTHITLEGTGPGRLVLRDRNMPGWTARVDDQPVTLQGTMWREVDLPQGKHQVRFTYSPPGFATGMRLALFAVVVLLGIFTVATAFATTFGRKLVERGAESLATEPE